MHLIFCNEMVFSINPGLAAVRALLRSLCCPGFPFLTFKFAESLVSYISAFKYSKGLNCLGFGLDLDLDLLDGLDRDFLGLIAF